MSLCESCRSEPGCLLLSSVCVAGGVGGVQAKQAGRHVISSMSDRGVGVGGGGW